MSPGEKKQFLEEYAIWKADTKLKLQRNKYTMDVGALSDEERRALHEWAIEQEITGVVAATAAHKVYAPLHKLFEGRCALAARLDKFGDSIVQTMNEKRNPEYVAMRLKRQDVFLLTYHAEMECVFEFDERVQKRAGQLGHLDAPAKAPEAPEGVVVQESAFVTMTPRAETSMFFDLSLEELLDGKTWSTKKKDKETNEWILRRLQFAHMATFEMQAEKEKEAERTGSFAVCEVGTVDVFRGDLRWHAGNAPLKKSRLPEVVLLFQFSWFRYAAFLDRYLDITGGFGQHEWTAKTAASQLKEVRDNTFSLSQVFLNSSGNMTPHPPHPHR